MSNWLLNPNVWFIGGLLIIGLGMAMDMLDVTLVLGTSAVIVALLISFIPQWFHSWESVSLTYIGLSVAIFLLLLRFHRNINNDDFDINDD